ncbi:MAG TPA: ABC-2 family transporter protein [Vicinamibacterales bacterium]|nr:ABC-2 family transporter protein [Vicinamibacterales bacterium]
MVADHVSFARALVATNVKATLALRGAFVIQVVFMALNNFAFFVFWWVLMGHVTTLRGWRLGDIQLLYGMVACAFGLTVTVAGGVRHLSRFIDDGDLDTLLTQPKSVLVHALGMRAQPSGLGDLISGLIFIVWSGQISWPTMPFVLIVVIASALVFAACGVIFFSLAFWLGRVETVATQLWDLLVMFSLYPEPLFGGTLRLVLFTVLPAGFIGYVPVRIVHAPSLVNAMSLLVVAIAYVWLAVLIFDRGLRRYASGSRFTTFG